jgi:WD40 repeat protein
MRLRVLLSMIALWIAFAWVGAFERAAAGEYPVEIVPQLGHSSSVISVAIAPKGKTALSGSEDGDLKLWDLATGHEIRAFAGHSGGVSLVAIAPDGKSALSCGYNTLKLWDLATGHQIRELKGHSRQVRSVAIAPDGKTVLSGGADNTLKLWDLASGRELRTFTGHSHEVYSVAIAPDGKTALSGSLDRTLKLWDVATGREMHTLTGHSQMVTSVAFAPDGKTALSGSYDGTLKLWDLANGREKRTFTGHSNFVHSVAIAPNGKTALSGSSDNTLKLWDLATGREVRTFPGHSLTITSVAFAPDGKTALSGSSDRTLKLWDLATGRELRAFTGHSSPVASVVFAPDGKTALSGGSDPTLKLWDLATGREVRTFTGHSVWSAIAPDGKTALSANFGGMELWDLATGSELRAFTGHSNLVTSIAIAVDGKTAVSGSWDHTLKLWNLATGREIHTLTGHSDNVTSIAIAPDGKTALSSSSDETMKLWDLATGRELRTFAHFASDSVAIAPDSKIALSGSFDGVLKLWDLETGRELRAFKGHSNVVTAVAFSPDGTTAVSGSWDHTLKLWSVATGREILTFTGHSGFVNSVAIAPDGRTVLSASEDGTIRLWNLKTGEELAAMLAAPDGVYLAITPRGFFASSHRDTEMLAIARGMESITIGQVHQSLFNPDLVREALAGDSKEEVKRAAEVVNLEKVIGSGPPPVVAITSHAPGSQSGADLVTVTARITEGRTKTDSGTGIGRVEWRVNGITAGVSVVPAGKGRDYEVKQQLALDPGENKIEVIAYNGRNLLASLPAQTTITYTGAADTVRPKLHVLAIGINQYADEGWTPPGESEPLAFGRLRLAVGDAKALAAELQKAGVGQYNEVRVKTVLDAEATAEGLDRIVSEMAAGINPRDTFVFFAAAHGYSLNGRFYLIPQDYQGGNNPEALATRAIGQDKLQDWIANRIKAKKAVILLDTCESGALTNGYAHSRVDAPASEAGVGRLHEATGRPVLTAAAAGQYAHEGVIAGTGERRGVFTWAVLDALKNGDTNGDGYIQLSELVAHVQSKVPGIAHGMARAVTQSGPVFGVQTPRFGSTGEDFAVVRRLQ